MNLASAPRGSLFALMLIIAGALLFLDNLGVLPIGDIGAYQPAWMIAAGILILDRKRTPVAAIWAAALIVCGILIILGNLRILHVNADIIYPTILIAFGVTMLVRPVPFRQWQDGAHFFQATRRRPRYSGFQQNNGPGSYAGSTLNEAIVFSALKRRVDAQNFEGGKLDAVFGSIDLDLSGAGISSPDRQAAIEANAVFGGIEITVPRTWKVVMKSGAAFGGCDNKTVPPRPEAGFLPETLIITGEAVFGGITVRN